MVQNRYFKYTTNNSKHRYLRNQHQRRNEEHQHHYFPTPDAGFQNLERCIKCGLTNHLTNECRHQNQVQCFNCKLYGHKDSSGLCVRK